MTDLHSIRQAVLRAECAELRHECLAFDLLLDHWLSGALKRFSPAQARLPRGQPGGGRWTDEEGAGVVPVAEVGRSVDLHEEEAHGSHVLREHVAKSDTYLLRRLGSIFSTRPGDQGDDLTVGSFTSVEAAEKLINSTLAQNREQLGRLLRGEAVSHQIEATFSEPTGYEAYLRSEHSSP